MKFRQLGRSALQVSELCLGTMNFGPRTSEQASHQILDRALEAGINFIDTANQYGGDLGVGATESILGRWLAQDPGRREQLVIATKVHEPMGTGVNDWGLSARHIQMACDASLQRLGVERIDLYQMHHIDRRAPIEEIWQAMDRLIDQGKITYVGSSNFPGWGIARANERAQARQRLGIISEQAHYNLIERRAEMEVIPACRAYGVGVIPWSPLAGGLLAVTTNDGVRRSAESSQQHADQLIAYGALCQELGHSPSAVAIAWLLQRPGVVSTIIGPGRVEQLDDLLSVPDIALDASVVDRLEALFPTCGESPEAFAW